MCIRDRNQQQLVDALKAAFTGNPLFTEVISGDSERLPRGYKVVGLIMTKSVVQFYNDNPTSDFFSNFNDVTAHVVRDLIHGKYVSNTVSISMGTAVSPGPK